MKTTTLTMYRPLPTSVNLIYENMVNPKVRLQMNGLTVWNSSQVIRYVKKLVDGQKTLNTLQTLVKESCFGICDVVVLITRDKIAVEQGRKSGTASGLARTSSVCTDMKVAIVHDIPNSYAAVVTLAHEVAHLLGATHDGQAPLQRPYKPPGSKKCPPTDGYLMGNGDLGANKTLSPSCINVTAEAYEKTQEFPGKSMTPYQLCQLLRGRASLSSEESDHEECNLTCCDFEREDAGPFCTEHKFLDGMKCSEAKTCRKGVCTAENWETAPSPAALSAPNV
ncbi:venom metalloproteinase antarease-like TpachMP_B isoform X2 [Amblyomma americanum]